MPPPPLCSAGVTHALAHVILGAHEILHLRAVLLVEPLQFSLLLHGFLQGPGQRQRLGLLLPGLCLCPVTFLSILGRDGLLLSQELEKPEGACKAAAPESAQPGGNLQAIEWGQGPQEGD